MAKLNSNLSPFMKHVHKGAVLGLTNAGAQAVQDVESSFSMGPGLPSPPGTPPAVQTGKLLQSIDFQVNKNELKAYIGTNLEYARIHELGGTINHPGGTPYFMSDDGPRFISIKKAHKLLSDGVEVKLTKPHIIRMPARPYLRPTMRAQEAIHIGIIMRSVRKEVKKFNQAN